MRILLYFAEVLRLKTKILHVKSGATRLIVMPLHRRYARHYGHRVCVGGGNKEMFRYFFLI